MSALPAKANISRTSLNVRYVPLANIQNATAGAGNSADCTKLTLCAHRVMMGDVYAKADAVGSSRIA
jgi:hypothetical protein